MGLINFFKRASRAATGGVLIVGPHPDGDIYLGFESETLASPHAHKGIQSLAPPSLRLLLATVDDKYPDLKAQSEALPVNAFLDNAATVAGLPKRPDIDNMGQLFLYLAIWLENKDTIGKIEKHFPEIYDRAMADHREEQDIQKFTISLLNSFGIQDRLYPRCCALLRFKVNTALNPLVSRPDLAGPAV